MYAYENETYKQWYFNMRHVCHYNCIYLSITSHPVLNNLKYIIHLYGLTCFSPLGPPSEVSTNKQACFIIAMLYNELYSQNNSIGYNCTCLSIIRKCFLFLCILRLMFFVASCLMSGCPTGSLWCQCADVGPLIYFVQFVTFL